MKLRIMHFHYMTYMATPWHKKPCPEGHKRGRTTNGEIGPVADKIYEIWSRTILVIWVYREKSKLCIYTKHSSLVINLHEQQVHTFVQFSDLAKNWHFAHLLLSKFLYPHPSIQKLLIYKESSENALNICGYKNWISGWGIC